LGRRRLGRRRGGKGKRVKGRGEGRTGAGKRMGRQRRRRNGYPYHEVVDTCEVRGNGTPSNITPPCGSDRVRNTG